MARNKISSDRPILITGAHRSGTTWAARMLGLAPETVIAEERPDAGQHLVREDGLSFDQAKTRAERELLAVFESSSRALLPKRYHDIDVDDLRAKLREANVIHMGQVRAVVFETTGDVSVLHGGDGIDGALIGGVRGADAEGGPFTLSASREA